MFFSHLLVAFLIALLLGGVLAGVLRRRYPLNIWLAILLVTFLAAWAGGIWVTPGGGALWGGNWLAALAAGLIIALLLAAVLPSNRPSKPSRIEHEEETSPVEMVWAFGGIFWFLIAVLLVVILLRYTS